MSIFDKLKSTAGQAVNAAAQSLGSKRERFTFAALPESLAEMQALPEASLDTPFKTAALTVLALCAYAADKSIGTEMLNWLRGPRPLNGQEISFLNDRFRDGVRRFWKGDAGLTPDLSARILGSAERFDHSGRAASSSPSPCLQSARNMTA